MGHLGRKSGCCLRCAEPYMVVTARRGSAGADIRRSETVLLESFGGSSAMRWALILGCLAGFCRPQVLCARGTDLELHAASLICGGTRFLARTEIVRSVPTSQTIDAFAENGKSPVQVDLRQTRISYPFELGTRKGLASFVSGWQCRKTPMGRILVLWYVCPQDLRENVPDRLCSITGEWERYVAMDGSLLDQGFSFDDPKYDGLRAKLGYHDRPDQRVDDGRFTHIH